MVTSILCVLRYTSCSVLKGIFVTACLVVSSLSGLHIWRKSYHWDSLWAGLMRLACEQELCVTFFFFELYFTLVWWTKKWLCQRFWSTGINYVKWLTMRIACLNSQAVNRDNCARGTLISLLMLSWWVSGFTKEGIDHVNLEQRDYLLWYLSSILLEKGCLKVANLYQLLPLLWSLILSKLKLRVHLIFAISQRGLLHNCLYYHFLCC